MNKNENISQLNKEGFSIVADVYSKLELNKISDLIVKGALKNSALLKSKDLFAIRELANEIPELASVLFNEKLRRLLNDFQTENELFLSKAIYFDKLKGSNWFVAYHQDLTINVTEQKEIEGFKNWTNKKGQIGVQPPTEYLNRTITIRIHLDDTDETNGALRVLPESHINGVVRLDERPADINEVVCELKAGDVMLMKPLTFHASSKSSGQKNRRVIHLEVCDKELPEELKWKERQEIARPFQSKFK